MSMEFTPMRWPDQWKNPSAVSLLKGTSINCLLVEDETTLQPVISEARRNGLRVMKAKSTPPGVTVVSGVWPGIKMSQSGHRDESSTGPTGAPWVNSNGWKVRLAAALNPQSAVWVEVAPENPPRGSYTLCFSDAAAFGGRWIISLDEQLARGIQAGNREALESWQDLVRAANFFAAHSSWSGYTGEAVVGVVSSFSGENEFLSHELLNLLTRTWEQYRIIPKDKFSMAQVAGLRAVVYPDSDPPSADLRKQILDFVGNGGLLVTGPQWGEVPGNPDQSGPTVWKACEEARGGLLGNSTGWNLPRYNCRALSRGRIAIAKSDAADPYLLANDTVAFVSHQHDLLRFWDVGAVNAYLSTAPDRKRSVAQMVFYVPEMVGRRRRRFGQPRTTTVRVAGQYRTAQLLTFERSTRLPTVTSSLSEKVGVRIQKDAVELHLPRLSHYAAVELSA